MESEHEQHEHLEHLEHERGGVLYSIRKFFRRIIIAIVIIAILALGFIGWSFYAAIYKWRSPLAADVEIEQGATVQAIAQKLADQQVVRTPQVFSAFARIRGVGGQLKAGEYSFPAGLTAEGVLNILVKGQVKKYRLQIIEGWTIKDIAKYISEQPFIRDPQISTEFVRLTSDRTFIDSLGFKDIGSLEGYLFPDTYEVLRPKSAEEIIKRLVARFREVWTPEDEALAGKMGLTQQQVVTLASIIEKETGRGEERPLIASVFINRLKQNMALQSDPTVIYGISNFDGNLRRDHLENGANPYNTYMHLGLPSGPICSPGKNSIEAALNPASTKYLYFVSKNDGSHVFSETLEEHQRAVAVYQSGKPIAMGEVERPTGEVEPPPGVTAIPPLIPSKPTQQAAPPGPPTTPTPAVPPALPPMLPAPPPAAVPTTPAPSAPGALPGPALAPQPSAPSVQGVPSMPAPSVSPSQIPEKPLATPFAPTPPAPSPVPMKAPPVPSAPPPPTAAPTLQAAPPSAALPPSQAGQQPLAPLPPPPPTENASLPPPPPPPPPPLLAP